MSDQSDKPDRPEDLEDITDEAVEIIDDPAFIIKAPPCKMYWIEIQNGSVFAGTLFQFEETFFKFPEELNDEEKINSIEIWALEQGWYFQVDWLH